MERITCGATDHEDGNIATPGAVMIVQIGDTALEIVNIQGMTSLVLTSVLNMEKITTGVTPSLAGITALQGLNPTGP